MFAVHNENPFARPGRWFRGGLHAHSTRSDGQLSPEAVLDWYRSRGYHFLALTDHGVLSETLQLGESFISLAGIEIEGFDPVSGEYHLVGLGLDRLPDLRGIRQAALQEAVDRLRAAGALVVLAHPYWTGQMSKDLLDVEGCFALEVYNGGCEVDDAKGFSTVHWDDLLAAGRRLGALAVDDAHWRNGDRDAGQGWVWVKARALTREEILAALREGAYYASSGPQILDLRWDETTRQITVQTSPCVAIDFVGEGPRSRRVAAPAKEVITSARHQLRVDQRYVRVACCDAGGAWAWSNPLFFASGVEWLQSQEG